MEGLQSNEAERLDVMLAMRLEGRLSAISGAERQLVGEALGDLEVRGPGCVRGSAEGKIRAGHSRGERRFRGRFGRSIRRRAGGSEAPPSRLPSDA